MSLLPVPVVVLFVLGSVWADAPVRPARAFLQYQDKPIQRWSRQDLLEDEEPPAAATYPASQPADRMVAAVPATQPAGFTAKEVRKYLPDPLDVGISDLAKPRQEKLSLEECIARTLENSLQIRSEGFNPAISATDVLAAEAQFDAVYFLEAQYNDLDQPTPTQLVGGQTDTRTLVTGLSKLMPTGATVTGSYNLRRTFTDNQFVTLNPAFNSDFVVELRQPLLRGFGVDRNRSVIDLAVNKQRFDKEEFRRQVREVLAKVEQTYWQLVQARRDVVIQRELVKQTEETLAFLKIRLDYDVYRVQISRVEALLGTRRAEYEAILRRVGDLEDQLKNLMNDPDLNLGEDIEIVPTDLPVVQPFVVDRVAEVQAALNNRAEMRQAKLNLDNTRINVSVAKNDALPKLDLVFRYTVSGLGTNAGESFDKMSGNNFLSYFVGVSFEYPLGNRAARAAIKRRLLERDQAITELKRVIEGIIFEVNTAVRALERTFVQLAPSRAGVQAAEENLEAIVARKISLSPEYLEVRLRAQETLADARRGLLNALVNYNISIVELERAKDTLLEYNNVVLSPMD